MLNSDDSSATGRIPLVLNESAVESGILMLYIENNDTLTITVKLPELDEFIQRVILDTKKFPSTVQYTNKGCEEHVEGKEYRGGNNQRNWLPNR